MHSTIHAQRSKIVRTAAIIALAGNLFLAVLKIATGFFGNSLAVLSDGIDSSTDVAIALMSLVVGSIITHPSDKKHPWGHQRAETIATIILAFLIMTAGFQLFLSAIQQLRSAETLVLPGPFALIATAISIAGKLLLTFSQFRLGKQAESPMILANARNMTNDIVISISVLVGLGLSLFFKFPILDPIIALAVALWVMRSAFEIFREQNLELMDGNADVEQYRVLFDAVKSIPQAGNPHRARIRKMAASWDIDLDIEVDGSLTVSEAHEIAETVEQAIRNRIPDVYDIMIHIEPQGQGQHTEQFGLSAQDIT